MPYKISGTKSETGRVIIIKESDWSIESNTVVSGSEAYSIEDLESGSKLAFSRAEDGEVVGFGAVASEEYAPPVGDRGVFGGGNDGAERNIVDYITISSAGNATNFGDLTVARLLLAATSNGTSDRGVFGGGMAITNVIDYITISSIGNAIDFGDLLIAKGYLSATSNGSSDRGLFVGGGLDAARSNVIEYITISSTSNSIDFGDMTTIRRSLGATSNGTNDRGVFAGGMQPPVFYLNIIDYVTISTPSNATDFGDLLVLNSVGWYLGACSNGTNNRGIFAGSHNDPANIIEYITISTSGNATDFGDLTAEKSVSGSTSNGTSERGVLCGGTSIINTIDYITISTPGNATDFGDLFEARAWLSATSNA